MQEIGFSYPLMDGVRMRVVNLNMTKNLPLDRFAATIAPHLGDIFPFFELTIAQL
jgi:hypothetical protein